MSNIRDTPIGRLNPNQERKMAQALAKKPETFPELIGTANMMGRLKNLLPKGYTPQRLAQIALTVFRNSPKLQQCTAMSILSSFVEAAQLGLELDKNLGHAYLVPFKQECTMIAGYRGYISLAMRT